MIYQFGNDVPEVLGYVADSAQVIGKVRIMAGASVWMGAVLRGDVEAIEIGPGSNVQENSSLHTSHSLPLQVGAHVTIGHSVTLHSCIIGDGSLIGMGATVLDGAEIGKGSLVAAGSLVTPGTKFGENSFILGSPAKRQKELGHAVQQEILANAQFYTELSKRYQTELIALQQSLYNSQAQHLPKELTEQQWKLVVYVPQQISSNGTIGTETSLKVIEELKAALFQAGAGELGLYRNCSWQSEGQGQFLPQAGSQPVIGQQQQLCKVIEYKLEMLCSVRYLKPVLDALYRVHPYECPAYEIYPIYQ